MVFRKLWTRLTRRSVGVAFALLLLLPATVAHAGATIGWQNHELQVVNWIHDNDEHITTGEILDTAWKVQNTSNETHKVNVHYVIWDPSGNVFHYDYYELVLNPNDVFSMTFAREILSTDPRGIYTVYLKASNANGASHATNTFKVY